MTKRGVNLGNWLLLERWMKPELFAGTRANDEHGLCAELGASAAEQLLRRHRETYVTASDFRWLRSCGIDAIRLPIGYWLLDPEPPFVGGAEALDHAVALCHEYGFDLNIDLHGLPGFQSTEHHSGRCGHFRWDKQADHLARSLDLVEQVAQRYRDSDCVTAISLVNEPSPSIDGGFLRAFYEQGYERVRRHMPADRVAVVISAFTEARLGEFHRQIPGDHVLTDIHPYPCFCPWEADQLLAYVAWGLEKHWPHLRRTGAEDLVIGEWSLGIAEPIKPAFRALPAATQDLVMHTFAGNQLLAFEQTAAWYFWNYKVEAADELTTACWSFRAAVERGWMPTFRRNDDPVERLVRRAVGTELAAAAT